MLVAHAGTEDQLEEDEDGGNEERRAKVTRKFNAAAAFGEALPCFAQEESDGTDQEEEQLSERGVENAEFVLVEGYTKTTEHALHSDTYECNHAEPTQPAALFLEPEPDRQNGGEKSDRGGHQPMGVFVEYASPSEEPLREREGKHVIAESGRPIGHSHSSAVAGDQSPDTDEEKSGDRCKNSERSQSRITRGSGHSSISLKTEPLRL